MRGTRRLVEACAGLPALAALALLASFPVAAGAGEIRAVRTLPAGTMIAAADLVLPEAAGAELRNRAEALVGLETRRAIYAGRPVDPSDLGPPVLVRRNSLVTMIYRHGGLGIRGEGRALDSGGQGETVRVMNIGSRRTVSAQVVAAATVEVRK